MVDLTAKLKLDIDQRELKALMGEVTTARRQVGGAGDTFKSFFGKQLAILTAISVGIGALIKSSGLLQGVLKAIGKLILFALKPLGDIIGVALMPILFILKPIGKFFNILMRPFIQKAMAAMRAGGLLLKEGKPEEALGAFTLGAQFLLKPFLDVQSRITSELLAGFANLLSAIPGVGFAFTGLGNQIRQGGTDFINFTTDVLDAKLGQLLARTQAETGKSMSGLVRNISDATVTISFLSGSLKLGMAEPFVDIDTWINNTWGPSFVDTVKKIFEDARKQQIFVPSPAFRPGGTTPTLFDLGLAPPMTLQQIAQGRPEITVNNTNNLNIRAQASPEELERAVLDLMDRSFSGIVARMGT